MFTFNRFHFAVSHRRVTLTSCSGSISPAKNETCSMLQPAVSSELSRQRADGGGTAAAAPGADIHRLFSPCSARPTSGVLGLSILPPQEIQPIFCSQSTWLEEEPVGSADVLGTELVGRLCCTRTQNTRCCCVRGQMAAASC